jgi:plastocyanin
VADPKGNLRWAFVYLKKAPPGKFEPPKTAVVVDQRLCRFEPRVLGIMVGQDLKIRNNDSLMHISHVVPNSNREWGFSQAKPGDEKIKVFSAREVMIRMGCDVHPWMVAWIGVLDHPFYAVTDALGQFEIKNIPPGTYTLEVWHEKFKSVSEEIEIKPRETKTSEFTLTERS